MLRFRVRYSVKLNVALIAKSRVFHDPVLSISPRPACNSKPAAGAVDSVSLPFIRLRHCLNRAKLMR
jgi:hypothetical protein